LSSLSGKFTVSIAFASGINESVIFLDWEVTALVVSMALLVALPARLLIAAVRFVSLSHSFSASLILLCLSQCVPDCTK